MIQRSAHTLRWTPLYRIALTVMRRWELRRWETGGRAGPTPHLWKRRVVAQYAHRFGLDTLVETGTFMGEMVAAMRSSFREVYSIELSRELQVRARQRFAGDPHVHILQGDSSIILPEVLSRLTSPALFWLDAHYSSGVTAKGESDTPVAGELRHILSRTQDDVILIDDAHLFVGGDYPSLAHVRDLVSNARPGWTMDVTDNLIRIHPRPPGA